VPTISEFRQIIPDNLRSLAPARQPSRAFGWLTQASRASLTLAANLAV